MLQAWSNKLCFKWILIPYTVQDITDNYHIHSVHKADNSDPVKSFFFNDTIHFTLVSRTIALLRSCESRKQMRKYYYKFKLVIDLKLYLSKLFYPQKLVQQPTQRERVPIVLYWNSRFVRVLYKVLCLLEKVIRIMLLKKLRYLFYTLNEKSAQSKLGSL